MRSIRFLVVGALVLGGCGMFGGDSSSNNNGSADLAVDATMAAPNTMSIVWDLYAVGTTYQTMKAVTCDDPLAQIKNVAIVVANMTGSSANTTAPCPAGAHTGMFSVNTPDENGNFSITATPDGGKATAFSHPEFDVPYGDNQFEMHLTVPFDDSH